jgi:outer membrane usher protein FimD/PapC
MTAPLVDDPIYFGVHYYLHHVENGVLIERSRAKLSMIADQGRLNLTVIDADGEECKVLLELEEVNSLIESLPGLRDWMISGKSAYPDAETPS